MASALLWTAPTVSANILPELLPVYEALSFLTCPTCLSSCQAIARSFIEQVEMCPDLNWQLTGGPLHTHDYWRTLLALNRSQGGFENFTIDHFGIYIVTNHSTKIFLQWTEVYPNHMAFQFLPRPPFSSGLMQLHTFRVPLVQLTNNFEMDFEEHYTDDRQTGGSTNGEVGFEEELAGHNLKDDHYTNETGQSVRVTDVDRLNTDEEENFTDKIGRSVIKNNEVDLEEQLARCALDADDGDFSEWEAVRRIA